MNRMSKSPDEAAPAEQQEERHHDEERLAVVAKTCPEQHQAGRVDRRHPGRAQHPDEADDEQDRVEQDLP
jgi:hypothetical protein